MFYIKVLRYMRDDNLMLRPLRFFDGPFISNGLKDEGALKSNGLSKPVDSSWFFVWWWIKKTYSCSFCIELDSRPIGFIGLYNLIPGNSAEISLVIFDKSLRGQGYGTRTFKLLAQSLQRHSVVREIWAGVTTDNHSALSFWKKLGFVEINTLDDINSMSVDLNSYRERYKNE